MRAFPLKNGWSRTSDGKRSRKELICPNHETVVESYARPASFHESVLLVIMKGTAIRRSLLHRCQHFSWNFFFFMRGEFLMSSVSRSRKLVVFCWELGSGLGHLGPIHPVVQSLEKRGYDVTVVSRDIDSAQAIFGHDLTSIYRAPKGMVEKGERIETPLNYAHILHNSGWASQRQLGDLVASWRDLFARLEPSLVICDHSPTARLAAHTLSLPAATFGTGFCCPPATSPLPNFRSAVPGDGSEATVESRLLNQMNCVLNGYGKATFGALADLLHRDTHHFLTTFRELDHYPQRPLPTYWGAWSLPQGTQPQWPKLDGKFRAVAYLKPFPYLAELLSVLVYQGVSLLVYCPGVSAETRDRLSSRQQIVFADQPIKLDMALAESDFAVFNAGHGSTVTALLAGKPVLQVPLNMEQTMTSQRVCEMNAGERIDALRPLNYSEVVERILDIRPHQAAARSFADRYRGYDVATQVELLVDSVELLAEQAPLAPDSVDIGRSRKTRPEVLFGLSPSEKMLSRSIDHFAQFPGTSICRQPFPLLPWDASVTRDSLLQSRLSTLERAYPGVSLIGDLGVSYLPYVRRIAALTPSASFLCIFVPPDDLLAEVFKVFASRYPGRAVNHWSEDRSGFDDHPLDACYPTYSTRDLAAAVTRFHREYFSEAEQLAGEYPTRFQIVDAATLPRVRHAAVSRPDRRCIS